MKRTRLRSVSPKRAILNREYEKAKRQWRAAHDGRCEMQLGLFKLPTFHDATGAHRCRRPAMHNPHHSKGRGKFLCAIDTFIALCPEHHRWVDTHRKQAVALGYFTYEFK